jgi:uncharacterized tellurite resistance protein B-like protein
MLSQNDFLTILSMAITVDGVIHHDELDTVKALMTDYFPDEDISSSLNQLDILHSKSAEDLKKRYYETIDRLSTLPELEKSNILKLVLRVVDADNVMHETEHQLVSELIERWNLKF